MLNVTEFLNESYLWEKPIYRQSEDGNLVVRREDGKEIKLSMPEINRYLKENPPSQLKAGLRGFVQTGLGGLGGAAIGGLAGAALSGGNPLAIASGASLGSAPGTLIGLTAALRNQMINNVNAAAKNQIANSYRRKK